MSIFVLVLAVATAMIIMERSRPGSARVHSELWWLRALASTVVQTAMVFIAAFTWDQWLSGVTFASGERLGTVGGALVGYLVITFIYYWWHRARHEIPVLWRWLHQIHHSAARLETITTFYKHPLEILVNSVLNSLILHVLLGITPAAATTAVAIAGIAELFYHWNTRTPYWLGFFIQRPESHRIHHRLGYHRNNYSDLPLWDILFGTFENAKSSPTRCGFTSQHELQVWPMLLGKNVHGSVGWTK